MPTANAITDSTAINASIANVAAANDIPFDAASTIATIPAGRYPVQVTPNSGSSFTVSGVPIVAGSLTTVFTYGVLANGTQGGFAAVEPVTPPPGGQALVQPLLAAAAVQSGDFQFIFTSTRDASATPVRSMAAFGQSSASIALPPGRYRIQLEVVPHCQPNQACTTSVGLAFDSGQAGVLLPIGAASSSIQLAAVDATATQRNAYSSGVVLLLDGSGARTLLFNGQN